MEKAIFHIFLNSPVGRGNLMQSAYLAEKTKPRFLSVFIPTHDQCAMYCEDAVLTLDLDASYVRYPETARDHAKSVLEQFDVSYDFFQPSSSTGGVLPDIPNNWTIVACPRAISKKASRIGLGHLGPRVRSILLHGQFPLFIPAGAFTAWSSVAVLFGGPDHGSVATRIADQLASRAKVPLEIFTQLGDVTRDQCAGTLTELKISGRIGGGQVIWRTFDSKTLEENLYEIPHDSLVVVGTGKHSLVEDVLFGTTLEKIQSLLPNPLIVCGPKCRSELEF